jgi:hypothetical protein
MAPTPQTPVASDPGDTNMTRTYVLVVIVEAVVVFALWALSRYFA